MKQYFIGLIAIGFLFISCNKEHTPEPNYLNNLYKIGESVLSSGKQITLYSLETPGTGYNPLFIQVKNANGSISQEPVSLSTLMSMESMKHSSPSVEPLFNPALGLFESGAIFTMPSESMEWSVRIQSGGEEAIFKTNVQQTPTKVVGNFKATNGDTYVMAIFPYKNFRIGMNDFSVLIYKKESPMQFVATSGLTVGFYPYMTSMEHGSSNNVNPTEVSPGFYNGRVNFTMTGDWRFHFKVKSGETVLFEDATLDIVF